MKEAGRPIHMSEILPPDVSQSEDGEKSANSYGNSSDDLSAQLDDLSRLRSDVLSLRERCKGNERNIMRLHNENEVLRTRIEEERLQKKELDTSSDLLSQKIASARQSIVSVNDMLAEQRRNREEHASQMQESLSLQKQRITELQQLLSNLEANLETAIQERRAVEQNNQVELRKLKSAVQEAQSEQQRASRQRAELVKRGERLARILKEATDELAEQKAAREELERQRDEAEEILRVDTELRATLAERVTEEQNLQEQLDALERESQELQKASEERQRVFQTTAGQLRQQCSELREQHQRLNEQLNSTSAAYNEGLQRMTELQRECTVAQSELDATRAQQQEFAEKNRTLQTQLDELRAQCVQLNISTDIPPPRPERDSSVGAQRDDGEPQERSHLQMPNGITPFQPPKPFTPTIPNMVYDRNSNFRPSGPSSSSASWTLPPPQERSLSMMLPAPMPSRQFPDAGRSDSFQPQDRTVPPWQSNWTLPPSLQQTELFTTGF